VKISGICRLDAQVYVYAILLIANLSISYQIMILGAYS